MKFFNGKDKSINMFFVQQIHIEMLKNKNIPLSDLPYLLFYKLPEEDILDIIAFQQFVEEKYFGRKFTTYNLKGDNKFSNSSIRFDLDFLGPKLESIYKDTKYYEEPVNLAFKYVDKDLFIAFNNDLTIETGFSGSNYNVVKTIYNFLLKTLGYHQTYFRTPISASEKEGLGLSELIAVLTK